MSGGFPHSHPFPLHSNYQSSGESDSGSFSSPQLGSVTDEQSYEPYDTPYIPGKSDRRRPAAPEYSEFNPQPHRSSQAGFDHSPSHHYPAQQQHHNAYNQGGYDVRGLQPPQWGPSEGGGQGYYRHQTQSYPQDLPPPETFYSHSRSSSDSSSPPAQSGPHPGFSYPWPDPGPELRRQMVVDDSVAICLASLPDPPHGQKPSHALPMLIKLAIYGSPRKMLTLQEIYTALENRFEWFRQNKDTKSWKNSIRHNLSLNKVFRAVPRPITEPGKGHYWRVDMSEGEGHKRPRKRRAKGKTAQTSSDEEDEDNALPSIHASSGTVTGDPNVDPELTRQGQYMGGGWERPMRTSPYSMSSPTADPRSSGVTNSSNRVPHRPSLSNSGPPSPQSTSSSSQGGSPHDLVPPGPPAFGQSLFGQPSFPNPSFGHASSSSTSSTITPTNFPRAFMAQSNHVPLGPAGGGASYQHAGPAPTHDRYAPVVVPPLRPGLEIVGGPLPSARRIPNQHYSSPFSDSAATSGPHVPHNEHSRATAHRSNNHRGG